METPEPSEPPEPETHSLAVPRTARFLTLGNRESPSAIWFLFHGYGQLASDFLESARGLAGPKKLLVAPEALSRFYLDDHHKVGASWMTREDRSNEIEDYIRYLDLVLDQVLSVTAESRPRLGVLGFSQGVATAALGGPWPSVRRPRGLLGRDAPARAFARRALSHARDARGGKPRQALRRGRLGGGPASAHGSERHFR